MTAILTYLEDPAEELSRQVLAFARTLRTSDGAAPAVQAVTIGGGPYAPRGWAQALLERIRAGAPEMVLGPGTDRGNELLAHVAAMLDQPLAVNCISLTAGEEWTVTRVRWGGSLLEEARLRGSPLLMTVASHAVAAEPAAAQDFSFEVLAPSEPADGVRVLERVGAVTEGVSLADARVVVSGGRGVGSAEGFAVIEELAELLGGAVGCSRAVTMAGWRPHADQVGQTGTKVAPDIYIACGISGATQHMAGCKGAKKLLAINPDAEASIFSTADYGVIGDLHEVLPAISAEIRRARSGA